MKQPPSSTLQMKPMSNSVDITTTLLTTLSPLAGVVVGALIPAYFESKRSKRELAQQAELAKNALAREDRQADDARERERKAVQLARIRDLMQQVTRDLATSMDEYQRSIEMTGPVWADKLEELAADLSAAYRGIKKQYVGIADKALLQAVDVAYQDSARWYHESAEAVTNQVALREGLVMPSEALEAVTWAVHDRVAELGL